MAIADTLTIGSIRELVADDRLNQVRHTFDLAMLNLRQDTGELLLIRDQLADRSGLSRILIPVWVYARVFSRVYA